MLKFSRILCFVEKISRLHAASARGSAGAQILVANDSKFPKIKTRKI